MKLFIIMYWHSFAYNCNGYFPCKYTVAICRWNLPQLFAVGLFCVCKQNFFLCEWNFFLCKQTFLNWKQTFFIWEQNFFSFMRISFLTVFLFVIAVAVMGHRIYVNDPLLIKINYNILLMTQTLKGKGDPYGT